MAFLTCPPSIQELLHNEYYIYTLYIIIYIFITEKPVNSGTDCREVADSECREVAVLLEQGESGGVAELVEQGESGGVAKAVNKVSAFVCWTVLEAQMSTTGLL